MIPLKSLRSVFVVAVVLAFPSLAAAQTFTWTAITPTDGSINVAQPVQVSGSVTCNNRPITTASVTATAAGYSGTVDTRNVTVTLNGNSATFGGSISFSPPAPSGQQVKITFKAISNTSGGQVSDTKVANITLQ